MKLTRPAALLLAAELLFSCEPGAPIVAPPEKRPPAVEQAAPAPVKEAEKPLVLAPSEVPLLTPRGHDLIIEFEVGGRSGYDPRPEAPDARASGVTWGIGYDAHQNKPSVILLDWARLGEAPARRLAATNPYYGESAQRHLHEVRDILVAWQHAIDVFDKIDVAREFSNGRRLWPGFEDLRPNAQAALISQGFNRGWSTIGDNRREMKEQKRLVPLKNYNGMAEQMRRSERVWRGTSIEHGMTRRREAESALMITP